MRMHLCFSVVAMYRSETVFCNAFVTDIWELHNGHRSYRYCSLQVQRRIKIINYDVLVGLYFMV